jgi:hypothetical protein
MSHIEIGEDLQKTPGEELVALVKLWLSQIERLKAWIAELEP